jgi:hypothetical protein
MTVCYRLYTQNIIGTIPMVAAYAETFTVTETTGYYKGSQEHGLVIEIVATSYEREKVIALAKHIKEANNQESVLVTETELKIALSL